jgi:phosphoribosylformylglycinamidine synthase
VDVTLQGKLPQRKIATGAAAGYSSYGNQIGLATGKVQDFYHEKFLAKRMEVGAVIGAAPRDAVVREKPQPGDLIILLGGRTGRDGCGGATGSSKEHTRDSLAECGAEVQKGNALTERKILRLFRKPEVTALIKRCNDFGAGGVAVAIGELAEGVRVDLDKVPKKYDGLDGTELAISESQERMAVVVSAASCERFVQEAARENLEAAVVAEVTVKQRMVMSWRGDTIVDISRAFLDANGVRQRAAAAVKPPAGTPVYQNVPAGLSPAAALKDAWLRNLARIEVASQKGLVERFDSTIGRGSVLLPLGGRRQLTPVEAMTSLIPYLSDEVRTVTVMACGYHPALADWSPFYGALYAVVESVSRAVAAGADPAKIRLSLQEYFEKPRDKESWGKPLAALLGAYMAQTGLDTPAIGGKDSMSGSFMDLHVPPTLLSFAVGLTDVRRVVSAEFKQAGHRVLFLSCEKDELDLPDFPGLRLLFQQIHRAVAHNKILAACTVKEGGIAAALSLMCFGNWLGVSAAKTLDADSLFTLQPGGFILELADDADPEEDFAETPWLILGVTQENPLIYINGQEIALEEARKVWEEPLNAIFPAYHEQAGPQPDSRIYDKGGLRKHSARIAFPRVFIPVFPGTNCEYDTERAFAAAGGRPESLVVRNGDSRAIAESVKELAAQIRRAQILVLPGGFSAADEPEGSGKFIATMFRNPRLKETVEAFLSEQGGLILGICNGFQALIKLGLLPYGHITDLTEEAPTLTFNAIGRHVSTVCATKVVSNLSPWLALEEVGTVHKIAISSGEGRFYAASEHLERLWAAGQIATQYVDDSGRPSVSSPYNPNGSVMAVEGLTSPDGRIFGKMCHSERWLPGLWQNVPGRKEQKIFQAGIAYFS